MLNGAEPAFYKLPAGAMVLATASREQYLVIEDRALQPKKLSRFTIAQVQTMPTGRSAAGRAALQWSEPAGSEARV